MKKIVLILLAGAIHGLGHAASPPEDAGESGASTQVQRQKDPSVGKDPPPPAPACLRSRAQSIQRPASTTRLREMAMSSTRLPGNGISAHPAAT